MSRICGIYSPRRPELASEANLSAMLKTMAVQPHPALYRHYDGPRGLALGLSYLPAFPGPGDDGTATWSAAGRYVVAINGGFHAEPGKGPESGSAQASRAARSLEADQGAFPADIDGLYCMATWDTGDGTLLVAGDHMGTRPVYYYHDATRGLLAFASELKALIALPFVPRDIDMEALAYYLRKGTIAAPVSILRAVERLMPAERLVMTAPGELSRQRYWRVPVSQPGPANIAYWAPRVREQVTLAVERVTRRTPEAALLLSGGLDSSVVLAALAALGASRCLALTLQYEGGADDDAKAARAAADMAGVEHQVLTISPREVTRAVLARVLSRFDDPVETFSRAVSSYFLSAAAGQAGLSSAVNATQGEAIFGEAVSWPGTMAALNRNRPVTEGDDVVLRIHTEVDRAFTQPQVDDLLAEPVDADPLIARLVARATEILPEGGPFETYYGARSLMARGSLTAIYDEAVSPLNRVEVRTGFADRRLFEFAQAIPAVLRGSEATGQFERRLLYAAFDDAMPAVNRWRHKRALPGLPWWGACDHVEPLVLRQVERCKLSGIFKPGAIDKMIARYRERGRDRDRQRIWSLFVFQTWYDLQLAGIDPFAG